MTTLVTGGNGFLANSLKQYIDGDYYGKDMLDVTSRNCVRNLPTYDVLIHTATGNGDTKFNNNLPLLFSKAKKIFVRYVANGTLWKMGDMFQLSIELYDTKENKVVWLDRWQEKWDNLPSIKSNLSDGLLKALDTKPKVEKKKEKQRLKTGFLKVKHLGLFRKSLHL